MPTTMPTHFTAPGQNPIAWHFPGQECHLAPRSSILGHPGELPLGTRSVESLGRAKQSPGDLPRIAIDHQPGRPTINTMLSVICPTRNRATLWRSGWLLDSLRAQTEPPDELIIALDHTEDDTAAAIEADLTRTPLRAPVRILEVLAPRPGPNPASGIPDNCLFHAAAGDVIIHVDDDTALPPRFIELVRFLFLGNPPAIIWPRLVYYETPNHQYAGNQHSDCRVDIRQRHRWPALPGGLVEIPAAIQLRWGAIYVCRPVDVRAIGGHDLETCQYHNTDTRLGNRTSRFGIKHYFAYHDELACKHLGLTWYMQHVHDPQAIAASQGHFRPKTIANGGPAFWTSPWFDSAYKCLKTYPLTTEPTKLH
jgi:glycosyltransferase involved in cell wall biosynthesis